MPRIDLLVTTEVSRSLRVRQLEAMFDVPTAQKCELRWKGDVPLDAVPWNVGLIVGPSGSGKTMISRELFGDPVDLPWGAPAVVDDFSSTLSMQEVSEVCQAVGFNTIPAWMRPYRVLSNGERFRVELARRLLELPDPIVVDEFTSVVDRQVAKIGSHAVQKFVRRHDRKFVAVSCHYDVIEWLQPDWILEPATMTVTRRSLQQRPALEVNIERVPYAAWRMFAPFHYLTAELHRAAACFVLFVEGRPASFAGVIHRPHPKVRDIKGVSRLVTLPDWQGLGLAMILVTRLGAMHKAMGLRLHTYPAHPSLIRSFGKSTEWKMTTRATHVSPKSGSLKGAEKSRPCAVFEYRGPAIEDAKAAKRLLG